MQEIMYYLLFSSCKNHFLVKIYVDLFIPKRKSGQLLHACVLEMLIRLILYDLYVDPLPHHLPLDAPKGVHRKDTYPPKVEKYLGLTTT